MVRLALNDLFLVGVNTGRSSILTSNWFPNFWIKENYRNTVWTSPFLNDENVTKRDESYLSTVLYIKHKEKDFVLFYD